MPGQRAPGGLDSVERYADFAESCQAAGIPAFKIHGFFVQPPIYADGYGDEVGNVGQDGCVPVPTGPGLGVLYDVDRINGGEVDREEVRGR